MILRLQLYPITILSHRKLFLPSFSSPIESSVDVVFILSGSLNAKLDGGMREEIHPSLVSFRRSLR